ncbi:MAG: DUF1896 family protein [Ferruginibacter sp.]|nr:DUF1896 family protein [Ferruginibacter sp.]
MKELLIQKLQQYIIANNPDLLVELQGERKVTSYLQSKVAGINETLEQLLKNKTPEYIIEEVCMEELTEDLRPSRYNYLKQILEEEFKQQYEQFRDVGILTTEIVNLIQVCKPVFEDLNFSEENEDNQFTRYVIIGSISGYLESNSEKEKVSNGLQQSTETER